MKRIWRKFTIIEAIMLTFVLLSSCSSTDNNIDNGNVSQPSIEGDSSNTSTDLVESENKTSSTGSELENYCIFTIITSCSLPGGNPDNCFNFPNDEEYPPDNLWIGATERGTETEAEPNHKYIAVNLEGEYLGALDSDDYYIVSSFFDGVACVMDSQLGERKLVNTEMVDVTSEYVNSSEGETVIGLGSDKTGITLWTRKNTDTYNSHLTELFAKDLSGNVKQRWTSQIKLTKDVGNILKIEHINGAYYAYCYYEKYVVLNVETGGVINIGEQHSDIELDTVFDDGSFLTSIDHGNFLGLTWYSPELERAKKILLYEDVSHSNYGEGLMYIKGEMDDVPFQGFVDEKGAIVISLDANLNITNSPIYRGNYALIELENVAGETFVTLMDKTGNFAFEPIKGEAWSASYRGELEGHQYYIKCDGDYYYLKPDGNKEKIEFDFENSTGFLGSIYLASMDEFAKLN